MVKVYKNKEGKLVIYLPFEVTKTLDLKENEEIDFFKYNNSAFLFAKKSDITNMLLGNQSKTASTAASYPSRELSNEEIAVLKKLDTVKYPMRTKEKVVQMLNPNEKTILKQLMKKQVVSLFRNEKFKKQLFGISKSVYDKYLMRKKPQTDTQQNQSARPVIAKPTMMRDIGENEDVKELEEKGFIVLQYETQAANLSLALENSIRQGLVVGTRAFNKKFYIVLRNFFDRNSGKIMKTLKEGEMGVDQIARDTNIDEDGVRAVLYLLAESGDVSEKKKDFFALA